jgi:3-methyladenine DNA glycosylase AlkC
MYRPDNDARGTTNWTPDGWGSPDPGGDTLYDENVRPTTFVTTGKLKDFFDAPVVREIASQIARVDPNFDEKHFISSGLRGLNDLELTERAWHLAEAMGEHLPTPFPRAADVLIASLGPELTRTDEFGLAPLRYMPHVFFVQKYGLDDFESAMRAQYELTKRFSAESSIRAFLVRHPERTYARLEKWARDENAHVRRLVSEGTRPRLPWAPRLRAFQEDPRPVIALLELLKDDPDRYVERSVANNLNDIAKDHPDLAVEVCRRWSADELADRTWIVRHALRSLVKRGHRGALELLGVGTRPRIRVGGTKLGTSCVQIGEKLRFSFEIVSTAKTSQELLVDYAVHFVKADGSTRPKVFKLTRITLPNRGRIELASTVSFAPMTTRRPHPGRHRISAVINGFTYPLAAFDVAPATPRRSPRPTPSKARR